MKALASAAIVGLVALFVWIYFKSNGGASVGGDTGEGDLVEHPTADPFSSKVQELADAIAFAEGFGKIGATPTVLHNPGDLGPGDVGKTFPSSAHGGSSVSELPDDATGWKFLTNKLSAIFNGRSSVYSPQMTFEQMGQKYASDSKSWTNNVTSYLGITPNMTLAEWWSM